MGAGNGHPHQPAFAVFQRVGQVEQGLAQQRLRPDMALEGRKVEPAHGHQVVVLAVDLTQFILGFRIAEIRSGVGEDLAGTGRIGLDLRVLDAGHVVFAKRHEGAGDERCLRRGGAFVAIEADDLIVIFESLVVVLGNAVTGRIHLAQLPGSHRLAVLGRVAQGIKRCLLVAGIVFPGAKAQRLARSHALRRDLLVAGRCSVKGMSRHQQHELQTGYLDEIPQDTHDSGSHLGADWRTFSGQSCSAAGSQPDRHARGAVRRWPCVNSMERKIPRHSGSIWASSAPAAGI